MSMIGCFYAVTDNDLKAIIQEPKRIRVIAAVDQEPLPPREPSFFSRLFGSKPAQSASLVNWKPEQKRDYFDCDKAWHGIHFLLTGTAWEGSGPLAFIVHGGSDLKEDFGYDPARGFTSAEVKEIQAALQNIDPDALYQKADPAAFKQNEIYPEVWDRESKEECIGYVINYFKDLKAFVDKAAASNRAMIVFLG